jgi:uncharacterized protein (DUF58 family)
VAWRPTEKAGCYATLLCLGVVAALVSGRPEAAVMAAPFALALVVGLARTRPLGLDVGAAAGAATATEGDQVPALARFLASGEVPALEVLLSPAPGWSVPARRRPVAMALSPGQPLELPLPALALRWGRSPMGLLVFRARSLLGFFEASGWVRVEGTVVVYPRPEPLRGLVASRKASLPAGAHLSPAKGGGLDLAGVRPYAPGDRAKDVNWRASARHVGLYTNERHPERGSDVVLVVDTFDTSVLHRAVTGACSLVDAYLSQRDRLALLELGGALRWLRPGMGPRQRQVLIEALLSVTELASAVYRGVSLLPPRLVPTGALVVGVSSLESDEARAALVDMRARGLDVVVVEVPPAVGPVPEMGLLGGLAARLWRQQREVRREELRAAGVPAAPWEPGAPLAPVIEEVAAWARRQARSAS